MPIRFQMIASAKAVMGFSSAVILAQIAPITNSPTVDNITKLTLDGALVIAVGCLARAVVAMFRINAAKDVAKDAALAVKDQHLAAVVAKKDEQIVSMVSQVTAAMVLNNQNMMELRQALLVDGKVIPRRS